MKRYQRPLALLVFLFCQFVQSSELDTSFRYSREEVQAMKPERQQSYLKFLQNLSGLQQKQTAKSSFSENKQFFNSDSDSDSEYDFVEVKTEYTQDGLDDSARSSRDVLNRSAPRGQMIPSQLHRSETAQELDGYQQLDNEIRTPLTACALRASGPQTEVKIFDEGCGELSVVDHIQDLQNKTSFQWVTFDKLPSAYLLSNEDLKNLSEEELNAYKKWLRKSERESSTYRSMSRKDDDKILGYDLIGYGSEGLFFAAENGSSLRRHIPYECQSGTQGIIDDTGIKTQQFYRVLMLLIGREYLENEYQSKLVKLTTDEDRNNLKINYYNALGSVARTVQNCFKILLTNHNSRLPENECVDSSCMNQAFEESLKVSLYHSFQEFEDCKNGSIKDFIAKFQGEARKRFELMACLGRQITISEEEKVEREKLRKLKKEDFERIEHEEVKAFQAEYEVRRKKSISYEAAYKLVKFFKTKKS